MKRRTLLKSALGALSFGLLGKSEPKDERDVADKVEEFMSRLAVTELEAKPVLLGTIVLANLEWSVTGNNWTVKRLDG